jgi:hypothetical protein
VNSPRGAILVLTHSRPDLLNELLASIVKMQNSDSMPLILVQQTGHQRVEEIINRWKHRIHLLIQIDGGNRSTSDNIGRNRLAGYATAFEAVGADWVLAVEDDVILAPDTVNFVNFVLGKYSRQRKFRGINLGSRLKNIPTSENTYCETRFGIFGQAAVMPKKSWRKMQSLGIIEAARSGHWDVAMEAFMKTGLTVAPNNSRYVDRGWDGTHMPSDPMDPYYQDISESYIGNEMIVSSEYLMRNLGYWWRSDLKKFRILDSPYYWLRFILTHPITIKIYHKIKKI